MKISTSIRWKNNYFLQWITMFTLIHMAECARPLSVTKTKVKGTNVTALNYFMQTINENVYLPLIRRNVKEERPPTVENNSDFDKRQEEKNNDGSNKPQAEENNAGYDEEQTEENNAGSDKPQAEENNAGLDKPQAEENNTGFDKPQAEENNARFDKPQAEENNARFDKREADKKNTVSDNTGSDKSDHGSDNTDSDKTQANKNNPGSDNSGSETTPQADDNNTGSNKSPSEENNDGSEKSASEENNPVFDKMMTDDFVYYVLTRGTKDESPFISKLKKYIMKNRYIPEKYVDDGYMPFLGPKKHDNQNGVAFGHKIFLSQLGPLLRSIIQSKGIKQPPFPNIVRVDKDVWLNWEEDMKNRKNSKLPTLFQAVNNFN